MAFSDIENNEKLEIIDIAIVNDETFKSNVAFSKGFKELGNEKNDSRLFDIKYVEKEIEAKDLLEDDKITGYLLINENEPKVVISTNGINETIFKYLVKEMSQIDDIIQNTQDYKSALEMLKNNTNINNISNSNLSYTMIEFYTLIAMACLYGGILGMFSINQTLPNMTSNGKRVAVSPTSKRKLVLSSVLAGYITQIVGLAILFTYTIFVLKVDYGNNLLAVIGLALVGALAGLTLGIMVATVFKSNENTKTGVILAITMLGCFLSGMMGITMKYIIDKNISIVNKINPVAMITDGFYSLYYYDTLDRYFFNVYSLLIFSFIMILIAFRSLRRQTYDSI